MKKIIFGTLMLGLLFVTACSTSKMGNKMAQLSINFKTLNTIEGYDHLTRMIIYCDEKEVARSTDKIQSMENTLIAQFPKGKHTVKFVMEAYDKKAQKWEIRTLENQYSFDCSYQEEAEYSKPQFWKVTFNIEGDEDSSVIVEKLEKGKNKF